MVEHAASREPSVLDTQGESPDGKAGGGEGTLITCFGRRQIFHAESKSGLMEVERFKTTTRESELQKLQKIIFSKSLVNFSKLLTGLKRCNPMKKADYN